MLVCGIEINLRQFPEIPRPPNLVFRLRILAGSYGFKVFYGLPLNPQDPASSFLGRYRRAPIFVKIRVKTRRSSVPSRRTNRGKREGPSLRMDKGNKGTVCHGNPNTSSRATKKRPRHYGVV